MLYEAVPVTAVQTPQPLAVYLLPAELPYRQLSGHFLETELHVVWCSWLMPLHRYFQVRPCKCVAFSPRSLLGTSLQIYLLGIINT